MREKSLNLKKKGGLLEYTENTHPATPYFAGVGALKMESEERYRGLFEAMREVFFVCEIINDASGKPIDICYLDVNPACLERVRLSREEIVGHTYLEVFGQNPAVETWLERLSRVSRSGEPDQFDLSGEIPGSYFEVFAFSPKPGQCAVVMNDITGRVRAEKQIVQMKRLYATLSQVNQAIIRIKNRAELYDSICDIVLKFGEFPLAWIGLLDERTGEVKPVAARGMKLEDWDFPIVNIHSKEYQHGITCVSILTSRAVTDEDIHSDEGLTPLRKRLNEAGYRSVASVPFRLNDKVIGALTVASTEWDLFKSEDELSLLDEMGLDISFALDTMETEKVKRQWEDAFEHCAHGLAIGLSSNDTVLTCNPAFARQQGRTVEEISSMPILDMYEPSDHEQVKQGIARADLTGRSQYEVRMKRKDGSLYPVQVDVVSVRDEQGNLLYRVATQQDITERRQAVEKLQESEHDLQNFFNNSPDTIYVMDMVNHSSQFLNREEFLGYTRHQLESENSIMSAVHPDDYAMLVSQWKEMTTVGESQLREIQYRVKTRQGGLEWIQQRTTVLSRSESGAPQKLLITLSLITKLKQAEMALHEADEKYRNIFENAVEAITQTTPDGKYISANPATAQILGYDSPEDLMKGILDLNQVYVQPGRREEFKRLMQEHGRVSDFESEVYRKDRSRIWISENVYSVFDRDGELHYYEGTAQDITRRKLAELEIQQRTEDLTLISALNDAVNRGEDIQGIAEVFAREVRSVFNCQDVAIYLLSPDGKYLQMQSATLPHDVTSKIEKLIGRPIPKIQIPLREGSYFSQVLANEQGTITSDPLVIRQWIEGFTETTFLPRVLRAPIRLLVPQIQKFLEIQSAIVVPLISSGRTIGLLDMSSKGELNANVLRRIRNISLQMTAVIQRKQAEKLVEVHLRRMRALTEIDRAISSSLDMRLSLDILLDNVLLQLGVDAASVLLLNSSSQTLEYEVGKGFRSLAIRKTHTLLGRGLSGRAGMERRLLHVPDLGAVGAQFHRRELLKDEEFVEYFGVPLIAKGMLKGVLEIFNRASLDPDMEWVNYLETLGGQAAIAIDNAQLFEGMQRSNLELITAYDATIEGWSRAMDLRDKETEGHTQRVTEVAVQLARMMGMGQHEIVQLRRGALLHDIGKLGVPDQILHKPDKLDRLEWAVMRQHPTYAFNMLMSISYLRSALDIPYCHHEKWDGSGYPRGLKGEEIPLAARVFAVVDVWDALRSDRPYRPAWTVEKARELLIEESGKHFDMQVVEAFLEMLKENPELF